MTTTTTKLVYRLSAAGRKAAVMAGLPAQQIQEVEIPTADIPEIAREHIVVDEAGQAWISLIRDTGSPAPRDAQICALPAAHDDNGQARYPDLDAPIADPIAWLQSVPAAVRESAAAARASAKAAADKDARLKAEKKAEQLAKFEAFARRWLAASRSDRKIGQLGGWGTIELAGESWQYETVQSSLGDEIRAAIAADKSANEADEAAEIAARNAARDIWIREHGSDRLKKCLDLGMADQCAGVYRDERLAHDFPDWIIDCAETENESEIRNPSIEALAALEEARKKISPDAKLVKVRPDRGEYDDAEPEWREAVRLDDLPGIESSKVFYRLV